MENRPLGAVFCCVVFVGFEGFQCVSSQQKAVIAIEAEDLYRVFSEQAKQARIESGGDRKSEDYQKSVRQKIDEPINAELSSPIKRRTDTKLAKTFGTNREYVNKVKRATSSQLGGVFAQGFKAK